jgi:hypothetical protein
MDDFTQDLNKLTRWDGENPYWDYDTEIKNYKLKSI